MKPLVIYHASCADGFGAALYLGAGLLCVSLIGCKGEAPPVQKPLSGVVLIHAYVSAAGVPKIEMHQREDMNACRREATVAYNRAKVGSARAWCMKLRGE